MAWPFLSPERGAPEQALSSRDRERLALLEQRDAAYAGLRDLEQDHRTGKVSDEDYESERVAAAHGGCDSAPETRSARFRVRHLVSGGLNVGFWQRFTNIFKAKANRALDRAENPSETLDYSYQRQLEMLQKVKRGLTDVVTAKKRLQHQTQALEQSVVKLDGQARQALAAGRDDLARTALERKVLVQEQLQGLDQQIAGLEAQQQQMVEQQQQLSQKVESFRTQKEVIKAQYSAAEAQVRIGEATSRAVVGAVRHRRGHRPRAGQGGADAGARRGGGGAGLDRSTGRGGRSSTTRSTARSPRSPPTPRSTRSWPRSGPSSEPRPRRRGSSGRDSLRPSRRRRRRSRTRRVTRGLTSV